MTKIDWSGIGKKVGEGADHGIHLHPDFFSDFENYSKGEILMNHKEIYQTLNDGQLDELRQTIDLVLRSKLPEKWVEVVALYPLIDNKIDLSQDQMILFRDIVHYVFLNRERIKDSIYRTIKQEFFDSMTMKEKK